MPSLGYNRQSVAGLVARDIRARTGDRVDLRVADHRLSNRRSTADILVSYDSVRGAPRRTDIFEFVNRTYKGKLTVDPAQITDYPNVAHGKGAIRLFASYHTESLPADACREDTYRVLGGFVGSARDERGWKPNVKLANLVTAEVWTVDEDEDGVRRAFRQADEDLDEILRLRSGVVTASSVNFDSLSIASSANVYDVGDTVEYSYEGVRYRGCIREIGTAADGNLLLTIQEEESSLMHPVLSPHVFQVIMKAPLNREDDRQRLEDYFSKAYGKRDYARRLTRE